MTTKMILNCRRYFEALSAMDRQAYVACFSEDAVVHDPYGGRPINGRQGLSKWFDGLERTWSTFLIEPGDFHVSGNRVAATWTVRAEAQSGKPAVFSGIDVFTVGDDELISRLEGYWDFAAMLAQIH